MATVWLVQRPVRRAVEIVAVVVEGQPSLR
jgi:hypothetical protein